MSPAVLFHAQAVPPSFLSLLSFGFFFFGSSLLPDLVKQQLLTCLQPPNRHSEKPEYKDAVNFAKVDVDVVSDVAAQLGIRAMPTFLLFKDGQKVKESIGADPKGLDNLVKMAL